MPRLATAAPVRCRSGARRTCPRAAPTVATAAAAATCGSWPTATWRRCSASGTTRTARADERGRTAQGKGKHGAQRRGLDVPVPEGTVVRDRDGAVLADLSTHGDTLPGRRGWAGRHGQRPLPDEPPARAELRRAGRAGRGALARPRAEADGRRRARRLPQRRQEHADLRDLGGQAQDRRLPVHDARAPPRRRAPRRRRVRGGRHPRPHRRRQRGQGPRAPFLRHIERARVAGRAARPRRGRRAARPRSRSASCSTSSAATGPSCSSGRGWWSDRAPTSATQDVRRRCACSGVDRRGRARAGRPTMARSSPARGAAADVRRGEAPS